MRLLPHLAAALFLLTGAAAHAQEVHRCGNQYSDQPCGVGKKVDVSPAVRNLDSAGARTAGEITPGGGNARHNCAYWNEQVAYYDAMARQPQSPGTQGWIAERRKKTRDAQFRAGC